MAAEQDPDPEAGTEALAVELAAAREDVERLRREYARAKRTTHRRAAAGFAVVGIIALGAGILFPAERPVLLTLGAIGLFSAILTVYLTPERFVAADVGEHTYAQLAESLADLVATLGLSDHRVYVPVEQPDERVRLFLPQHETFDIPRADALDDVLVGDVADRERGLSLRPTGGALVDELAVSTPMGAAASPTVAADAAADGLAHTFELVDHVAVEATLEEDRIAFGLDGCAYGPIDRLDHPVVSTLACAVARATERPVTATIVTDTPRADVEVVCEWT